MDRMPVSLLPIILLCCLASQRAVQATPAAVLATCLRASTKGKLVTVTPSEPLFQANAAFRNWQGRHDTTRQPVAVVFPTSQQQVAVAVRCANAANIPFVPRSGGHSYEAMSLIQGGLVIDMTNMTTLSWVKEPAAYASPGAAAIASEKATAAATATASKEATAAATAALRVVPSTSMAAGMKAGVIASGPGNRLGVLYNYLLDQGLMFPGGTCPGVGVSGFLLGERQLLGQDDKQSSLLHV